MNAFPRRLPAMFAVLPVLALAVLTAAGCTFTERKDPPLKGERLSVLVYDTGIRADPSLASVPVAVAPPTVNLAWPQGGGIASHAFYHLALGAAPRRIFRTSAGEGASDEQRLLAQPVVDSKGRVFVLDVEAQITAIDSNTGRRLWKRSLRGDEDSDGTLGGGLAAVGGRVFVTTGFAQVIALEAASGKMLWRRNVSAPFRSAPTVADGRVFAVSTDNHSHALDATTGAVIWTHRGASELTSLLGGAAPAYDSGVVVVAYSTGELFGLRATNGNELWSDYLARSGRASNVAQIADIRASPVIDRGRVLAISNSGRMVALNLANGLRIWEKRLGSIQTPWAAGDFIYVVTTDSLLLCISRADGRIRWARSVPRYENPKKQEDLITWSGPVLAGDRLILVGSNRDVISVSPYTGDLLGKIRLPDPASLPPVVARNTLFIFTDDAELIAWR
jgi:outer membrane protein assembly factor BamB